MTTFVTHPSVRIKGTENNYTPVTCSDMTCMNRQNVHWHCPFCSCAESFNDIVILKAHYRVKHVDKGIDFAGLKVLRCCDTCDIVGAIKGEKKFKGAHWHCYRCRNGFNRRDEAIKHYRTHFRNPQTTFQIQIAQEVNHPNVYNEVEPQLSGHNLNGDESFGSDNLELGPAHHPQMETLPERQSSMPDVQVSVAANETVNSTPQAIMLIQGGNLRPNAFNPHNNNNNNTFAPNENYTMNAYCNKDKAMETLYTELQLKYQEAIEDKARLTMTVGELKLEMQMHMQEVARYQKREEELLNQLSIPLDKSIQDLLKQLENQHRELLYHQLAHIKRCYPHEESSADEVCVSVDGLPCNDHSENTDKLVNFEVKCEEADNIPKESIDGHCDLEDNSSTERSSDSPILDAPPIDAVSIPCLTLDRAPEKQSELHLPSPDREVKLLDDPQTEEKFIIEPSAQDDIPHIDNICAITKSTTNGVKHRMGSDPVAEDKVPLRRTKRRKET